MSILTTLEAYFDAHDWNYIRVPGMPVLKLRVTGFNGTWDCYAQAHEDQQQFVFYSVSPITATRQRRHALAEFITRANYGMILGNFEMDYDDGEIRYKTSIGIEGTTLTQAHIKQLVEANVAVMDAYLPGLERVIYGNIDPAHAIATIEDDVETPDEDIFIDRYGGSDSISLN